MRKRKILVGTLIVVASLILLSAPCVMAQDYCEGDFDYDRDQDGSDAFVFKSDFGRSSLGNPCPPHGPAPVPKTGQTLSNMPGDDGGLEKGVAWPNPRFTDNLDGTVTDNLTGLIWLKDANCFGTRNWNDALSDSNGLENGECGLTDGSSAGDWRLPNYRELFSLVDAGNYGPALPSGHSFTNVQSVHYWSSTTEASFDGYIWYVNMWNGGVDYSSWTQEKLVWPVREGRGCDTEGATRECGTDVGECEYGLETCTSGVWSECIGRVSPTEEVCGDGLDNDCDSLIDSADPDCHRFTDNGDGTVTDNNSGLVWLKDANCFGLQNWDDAMSTAASLDSASDPCGLTDGSQFGDWRLPTVEEWEGFVCTQYTEPAVCNRTGTGQWSEGDPFNDVQTALFDSVYWSSTDYSPLAANFVILYDGYINGYGKSNTYNVWPVRDP